MLPALTSGSFWRCCSGLSKGSNPGSHSGGSDGSSGSAAEVLDQQQEHCPYVGSQKVGGHCGGPLPGAMHTKSQFPDGICPASLMLPVRRVPLT